MITGFLINAVYVFVYNIIYFLPDGDGFPTQVLDAASVAGSVMWAWDPVLPVQALLNVIYWIILLNVGILSWRAILWVIGLIRGSGSPAPSN